MGSSKSRMEIWDEFAAAALTGLIVKGEFSTGGVTAEAARIADHMLKERDKRVKDPMEGVNIRPPV